MDGKPTIYFKLDLDFSNYLQSTSRYRIRLRFPWLLAAKSICSKLQFWHRNRTEGSGYCAAQPWDGIMFSYAFLVSFLSLQS